MKLDHTVIPATDKEESVKFFANIMGLEYAGIRGTMGLVRVDDTLTLQFDERQTGRIHLAFHVTEEEFDVVIDRLKTEGVRFGAAGSRNQAFNMQVGTFNGGRRFYFDDPSGQSFELMTVSTNPKS
jgi:catechol 2,3-dioxygenase-like lactoylglutathione lyase family enzyme